MRYVARFAALALLVAFPAVAQGPDSGQRLAQQREAMATFARMDGVWRGPAWALTPEGRHEIVQTERIGTFLGGTVRVVEGRGYNQDGSVGFNALGVISFSPEMRAYSMMSWAQGYAGAFPILPTQDGYVWEIPAGPGSVIRYTATFRDGTFREVGHRIVEGREPLQIFEMNLRRVGDSDWPGGNPIPMRADPGER